MKTCFVSTSIPYVNARPHIGFALELAQADLIARWKRTRGYDTFLLTGTDDNAIKNVVVAKKLGIAPRELCDRNALIFEDLVAALNISVDGFIRTSNPSHHEGARKFWRSCRPSDVEPRDYRGLYCVGCEDFYLERDLLDRACPIHGRKPDIVEERNYFFALSKYQQDLESLIEREDYRITPAARRNEALGFIRGGLQDYSISRDRARSHGWGVEVPDDPQQTIYVWFDALSNYVNGLGYADDDETFQRFWHGDGQIIHVIGKDVLKFHAVYWPALLRSAGLRTPTHLHVHGFLTVDGQKIGKSLGNAVDPFPIVDDYGADALRYYLLRYIPAGADSDFSHARFREIYNTDLANGLGNLVSRVDTLRERSSYRCREGDPHRRDQEVDARLERFRFNAALDRLWECVPRLNRDIESERPWELLRAEDKKPLWKLLDRWVNELLAFGKELVPFLPQTGEEIDRRFGPGRIERGAPLFPRAD